MSAAPMRPALLLQRLLVMLAAPLGLAACAQGTGTGYLGATSTPEPVDALDQLEKLPPVSELDHMTREQTGSAQSSRGARWFHEYFWEGAMDFVQWVSGAHWVTASEDAFEIGQTGQLNASPTEPFKFAVYALPATNLIGQDGATFIVASIVANDGCGLIGQDGATFTGKGAAAAAGRTPSDLPNPLDAVQGVHNFALANFSLGYWVFADAADDGLINLADQIGQVADYISPSGFAFVAPLLWSPDESAQMQVTGFTALVQDPADNTPGPALEGFGVAPVRGGIHVQWTDPAVSAPLIVMVHYSRHSFATPDEAGVVTLNYPIKNAEAVFTSPITGLHYVRAQTHNLRSGQSGPLTSMLTASPIPGDPLVLELSVDPVESEAGQPVSLSATGAQSYDWDLNDDGVYEILGDAGGAQQLPDGPPGPARVAVRGHDDPDGLALRSVTINRRGWLTYELDADLPCGDDVQLIRLADGRLAALYAAYSGGTTKLRYALADNFAPASPDEWTFVEVADLGAGISVNGIDLALVNGAPAAAVGLDYEQHYFYSASADGALAADWHQELVDPVAGTGLGEMLALAEVQGRPAVCYHGRVLDSTTGDPSDTCEALLFNRALDANGSSWAQGVEVDSRNLTAGADYCPLDLDMEVVAGYPAIIYTTSPAAMWDYTIRYAHCSTTDGSGAWNRSILIDNDATPMHGGVLADCNGAPGFVYSTAAGGDVLQFVYGAGSVNGGPGAPWQSNTIEALGSYSSFVVKFSEGVPWLSYTTSENIYLRAADSEDGSGPWSLDTPNTGYGGGMYSDFVVDGQGPPVLAYSSVLPNSTLMVSVKY